MVSARKAQSIRTPTNSTQNISSIVNQDFDIDKTLSSLSKSFFPLDKESLYILEILARYGTSTEYDLTKIGNNYNLSRFSIRRRIYGTSTLPSLLKQGLLEKTVAGVHKTGKKIKKFELSFRGILNALGRVRFEDMSIVKRYFDTMKDLTENKNSIIDVSILYAKYHIALILLWTKINRLNPNSTDTLENYFLEGITNHFLRIGFLVEPNDNDFKNFEKISNRYFVLKHTLVSISRSSKNQFPKLYSDSRAIIVMNALTKKYLNPILVFLVKYLVKDWARAMIFYALNPNNESLISFESGSDRPNDFRISLKASSSEADQMYEAISRTLKIKKSSVGIMTSIKFKKR